jgi:hypothetical protein
MAASVSLTAYPIKLRTAAVRRRAAETRASSTLNREFGAVRNFQYDAAARRSSSPARPNWRDRAVPRNRQTSQHKRKIKMRRQSIQQLKWPELQND